MESFSIQSRDGVRLVGEIQGPPDGKEILFLHGLRQSALSWEKQFSTPVFANHRMIRFDLRGHGDSDKPADLAAYSRAEAWADDLDAVIRHATKQKVTVVAWSLGAYVVAAYLKKFGEEKIAGISLVAPVLKLSPEVLTPLNFELTTKSVSENPAVRTSATVDFLKACFSVLPSKSELQAMLVINGMTPRSLTEGLLQIDTPDLEGVFAATTFPLMLSHGSEDKIVKTDASERILAIHAKAKLSRYDRCGHSTFFEEPDRFNSELLSFMSAI